MKYRYYCLYRPPVPGMIPRGVVNIVAFDGKRHIPEIGRDAYGYVEYDKPLSPQEIVNFKLAVEQKSTKCDENACAIER